MSMHPVIKELFTALEKDPLPAADTSSHWKQFGNLTQVGVREGQLLLRGEGFGGYVNGRFGPFPGFVGRWSYRKVSKEIENYERIERKGKELCRKLGIAFTYDAWKQVVALGFLSDHWDAYGLSPQSFVMIGDGYGFLGALIRSVIPNARVFSIDLPKVLLFQAHTHLSADPEVRVSCAAGGENADVIFLAPTDIDDVPSTIDCAVNMASMAEMRDDSIQRYFRFLRERSGPNSRFYCVNRRSKAHPDGTIIEFDQYGWSPEDEIFVDGPCPYYSHFWSSDPASVFPRIPGLRLPFLKSFDGILDHRLVLLAQVSE